MKRLKKMTKTSRRIVSDTTEMLTGTIRTQVYVTATLTCSIATYDKRQN